MVAQNFNGLFLIQNIPGLNPKALCSSCVEGIYTVPSSNGDVKSGGLQPSHLTYITHTLKHNTTFTLIPDQLVTHSHYPALRPTKVVQK